VPEAFMRVHAPFCLVVEHRTFETKGLISLALSSKGGEGIPTARMYRDFAVTVLVMGRPDLDEPWFADVQRSLLICLDCRLGSGKLNVSI
jgi:hypothetical protein